jgi:hypothetical protein
MARDQELLEEIRETFTSDTDEWRDIRAAGAKDMRAINGDPWEPADRKAREAAGRPVLVLDELGQYTNQVINDLRRNKRGLKVTARGNGATDKTAQFRQGKLRDIEYASNAQQAYTVMAENAIQRSYGALRIKAQYVSDEGFEQELRIEPIVNPDQLTIDPFALRPDGADMRRAFYHESMGVKEFKREYPGATVKDFSLEHHALAKDWLKADRVQVAEFWQKVPGPERTRYLLKPAPRGAGQPLGEPRAVYLDTDLGGVTPASDQVLKSRAVASWQVKQYVTNGLEILKRADWPGKSIPFVTCFGKILYVDEGSGSKRHIHSLVRLGLGPYMLYCFYRTCEAELVGSTTKNPVWAYEGQLGFEQLQELAKSLHEPVSALFANHTIPGLPDGQVLPLPVQNRFEPPIQALEVGAESARRAIQAAMGGSPLPTQAQRHNDKSGVALKQMEESAQTGSFHYADHYDESVTRAGAILDELIPFYYDTARETSVRAPNDDASMVRINDPAATQDGQPAHLDATLGDHDVTISVGPAMASEREASSAFADMIVGNAQILQIVGPQKAAALMGAAIRLKNVGPIGDEMAEIIAPKPHGDQDPKQLAQLQQQLQQQLQEAHAKLQEAGQIIATKQVESKSREAIAAAQIASKERLFQLELDDRKADREVKLAVAEEAAKVTRMDLFLEERARLGLQAADVASQQADHAHEVGINALDHQQQLEAGQQAAAHAAVAADQGQAHTLEVGQQAADLAPQPEDDAA